MSGVGAPRLLKTRMGFADLDIDGDTKDHKADLRRGSFDVQPQPNARNGAPSRGSETSSRDELVRRAEIELEKAEARIRLPRNPKLQEKVRAAAKARLRVRGVTV